MSAYIEYCSPAVVVEFINVFVLAFLNHPKTNHKNQFVNTSTKKIFRCSF